MKKKEVNSYKMSDPDALNIDHLIAMLLEGKGADPAIAVLGQFRPPVAMALILRCPEILRGDFRGLDNARQHKKKDGANVSRAGGRRNSMMPPSENLEGKKYDL